MDIPTWLRAPRARRALAAGAVALTALALVLHRAPASAGPSAPIAGDPDQNNTSIPASGDSKSSLKFWGPGVKGTIALSHASVLAGATTRVFAELTLNAQASEESAKERAPLSLVVVLDTSGSMAGEKIERARQSVVTLLNEMADNDEIALVRYSTDNDLIQPLRRLGDVRDSLINKVRELQSEGGTNIPPALSRGLRELDSASPGRVRRVVLVSDGLDSTRAQAEAIARESGLRGVTISSMGIGLDFDESYMGGVARAGHGNFAFVESAAALDGFLRRELKETAATTVERATATITLPPGVRFVRATGADATPLDEGRAVELAVGSLFAGDQRRVVLELSAKLDDGEAREIAGQIGWTPVGAEATRVGFAGLLLTGTRDEKAVLSGRDGEVLASATSVMASIRQLEAAEAFGRGDGARARALIDQNIADLSAAQAAAPAPAATALERQKAEYKGTAESFVSAAPTSDAGKKAAKAAAAKDFGNMARPSF